MENSHATNGLALQERLNQPQTVAALTRLLDRIDTLEQAVDRLAALLEQGPGMVAMVGDMVDETVHNAATAGVDVEARLKTALTLAEKLTAPDMVAKLDQLLSMVDQAPGVAAMVGDMVDDTMRSVASSGVDIEERLKVGLMIAEKLTAPDMVAKLDQMLAMADQLPQMAAMMGDIFDETYRRTLASGVNLESMMQQGARSAVKLSQLMESEEFDALMDSGMLDPATVGILGQAGRALTTSRQSPVEKIGIFGMLRALNDPDLQQAMGFLVAFGKEFGKTLAS